MASRYPTQSSKLNSGQQPQSYGAPRSNTAPSYVYVPPNSPKRRVIGRGLAVFLAILLLQTVLTFYTSDTLAKFIELKSAAFRASRERNALVAERQKSEQERERMSREREIWEKVPGDRVPYGAFWEVVWPAWDCLAYGKREYWGMLRNIPQGWSAIDACMYMPVEIKGVKIRRPYRCKFVDGSPHIHGYWIVDWDQSDCKPSYRNFHDAGCTSYRSGTRRIEAQIIDIIKRKEQDWWLMCGSTPMVWNEINYTSPTHCEERRFGRKVAMWDVPDESCL